MRASQKWLRRRKRQKDEKGAALIMVLLSIVVLTVFLTEFQTEATTSFTAVVASRDRLQAEYHARSAVNLSRLLLSSERTIRAAVAPMLLLLTGGKGKVPQIPVWEFSDQVLGPFNHPDAAANFADFAGLDPTSGEGLGLDGKGRFEVIIVDEDSKLNINTAARGDIISRTRIAQQILGLLNQPQYALLFEELDADGQTSTAQSICSALIDWADSDQEVEPCDLSASGPGSGAGEDNFYQTIGLPYLRKNAAYDSLDELRLIRGVGDDFWATFVDPEPANPKKRLMTVWGQGRVNVNTANAMTLLALTCSGAPDAPLCIDPAQQSAFVSTVTMVKSFTAGAPLFKSGKDFVKTMKGGGMVGPFLAQLGVEPVKFRSESEMRKMITTESKMFSIYASGVVPGRHREARVNIHAVVDFRSAQDLAEAAGIDTSGATNPDGSTVPPPPPQPGSAGGGALDAETLLQTINTDPGGKITYWRVQ